MTVLDQCLPARYTTCMPRPARKNAISTAIERQGRVLLLAYDQGLEHGPRDFAEAAVDPGYVLDIAEQAGFTGIVLHKGVAARYYQREKHAVPLVVKLNGRTDFADDAAGEAPLVCTVDEAKSLGATAVGFSLYLGSDLEARMMADLAGVVKDAHERRMPVVVWMNIRTDHVPETHRDMLAYAGRVALELGADYVQLAYGGNIPDFAWAVETAGKCKVLAAGGPHQSVDETVKFTKSILQAGAVGMIVGRRVWQDGDPVSVARAICRVMWAGGGRSSATL